MQSLQLQLQQNCTEQQLEELQRQLELLEVEKKEAETRLEREEKKNRELEDRGGRGAHTHTHAENSRWTTQLCVLHSNKSWWFLIGSDSFSLSQF